MGAFGGDVHCRTGGRGGMRTSAYLGSVVYRLGGHIDNWAARRGKARGRGEDLRGRWAHKCSTGLVRRGARIIGGMWGDVEGGYVVGADRNVAEAGGDLAGDS